ncbi:glycerol kinase GlpK [Flexivirga oryzae]|uniref:glycerol kinase n=1 Tax=Flexivirga oryzae TaxID=1794944 RepID=A0A839NEN0_9MICO|nr:glycerol kinase GlpK [Flexivirga oryzae]MBB2893151.1 glycerol kinase [Flexivirga oryzae]
MTSRYVLSIDQGTTSTRAMVFDRNGRLAGMGQREHRQIFPRPGWVEHDAAQIWANTRRVIPQALADLGISVADVAAVGVASQRETFVLWERDSGRPVCPAIVWQDTRSQLIVDRLLDDPGADFFRSRAGIPPAAYFTAPRLSWLMETHPDLRVRALRGELLMGTMETWLIWNLTGGPDGGVHVTDVTNASRTLLMNLKTLDWDPDLLEFFDVPEAILPRIVPSSKVVGTAVGGLAGVPVAAAVGDQQGALFGQTCFDAGEVKCTYGTGAFLLMNTGADIVTSTHGMLPTVAYQLADGSKAYALEGSIAVAGGLVQWVRDGLGLIESAPQIETLARTVDDSGGCVVVPAFTGLFSPYWSSSARGVISGLTSFVTAGHLARAVLESCAWQTNDVVEAMAADAGVPLKSLRVDGGMTSNHLLMQLVADVLDVSVVRPTSSETVSLGAAYLAGLAVGYWPDVHVLRRNWHRAGQWDPQLRSELREQQRAAWRAAIVRTLDVRG